MLRLLLLQVLASCLWLGHSEVVTNFDTSCPEFFYEHYTPSDSLDPVNGAWICQSYRNLYHYATLYDRDNRIPVYSAYIYQPGNPNNSGPWFAEPQLINENYTMDMLTEETIENRYNITLEKIAQSQAIKRDYNNLLGLDPCRLCPSGHQTGDGSNAIFTLTNTVPLNSTLNQGAWKDYEDQIMPRKTQGCDTTYVITGAVPGNTYISGNRVNVPSHIWSAACCLKNTRPTKAWGAIAEKDKNEVISLNLGALEELLTRLYGMKIITLFDNACPRE